MPLKTGIPVLQGGEDVKDMPEDAPMFSRKSPEKVELRGNPYLPDGAGNGSE